MITGSVTSLFWLFFIQEKTAGSLQLCNLLFKTTSIVKGTALQTLSMVDAIAVALPISIIAALLAWAIVGNEKENKGATILVAAE